MDCKQFSKLGKKKKIKKKNTKNIRQTLKAHISMMAGQICLKFGVRGVPPQGNIHTKNSYFPFRPMDA